MAQKPDKSSAPVSTSSLLDAAARKKPSRPPSKLWGWPAVAALLAAYGVLTVSSLWSKTTTFDENGHLAAGYSHWITGDWRLAAENGILPEGVMSLPLLAGDYEFPTLDQPAWHRSQAFPISHQFFFESGNDADRMLLSGRLVMATIATGLGLTIYLISRRLFGHMGGLVSLALFALSPTFLANGGLAVSDMMVSFMFLLAAWAFWALLQNVSPLRLAMCGVALGLLCVSKASGLLIIPIALCMLILRIISSTPLPVWLGRSLLIQPRWQRALALCGVVVVQAAVVITIIWSLHGFRYSAFRNPEPGDNFEYSWAELLGPPATAPPPQTQGEPVANHPPLAGQPGKAMAIVSFARDHKLLPESYLYGIGYVLRSSQRRLAFMNGEYCYTGWRTFFPYCFAVKNPLSLLAILVLAMAAGAAKWLAPAKEKRFGWAGAIWRTFYSAAPLWLIILIYGTVSISSSINIGHRHILPIYGPIFILAGAAAYWLRPALYWPRLATLVLIALMAIETLLVWPNYIPYFNQIAGGMKDGYKHLVDSSCDWGQDLKTLQRYLDDRGLPRKEMPVYFSYFGIASPDYYHVPGTQLMGFMDMRKEFKLRLRGGVYCISATMLQMSPSFRGPWTQKQEDQYQWLRAIIESDRAEDRAFVDKAGVRLARDYESLVMGRLCAFLRHRPKGPDDVVGYSILIYQLSDQELVGALLGPMTPDQQ